MKKTLGGDRLGAGKKMKVDLHGYERSTHDLGYIWRSTMSAGTLVPFLSEVALPGDTFDIDLDCVIKTHPTIGPLFGSYKVQLDIFQAPIRLYQAQLHNNKLGIGMNMAAVKLPQIALRALSAVFDNTTGTSTPIDNIQINPSCILSYLGLRGVGYNDGVFNIQPTRDFNALPLLAYWDIYKNYYANKQEEIGAVIHTAAPTYVNLTDLLYEMPDGSGGTIPDASVGGTIYIPLLGSFLEMDYATPGPVPDPGTILLNTSQGQLSLQQLTIGEATTGAGFSKYTFNYGLYGGIQIYNYEYATAGNQPPRPPEVFTFQLSNIDQCREDILADVANVGPFYVSNLNYEPYAYLDQYDSVNYKWQACQFNQEGLGIKTYQSDLFNNWLSTEWIDGAGGINEITAIDTSGGSFNIDTLLLARKVYDMLNRIAVSGGSYDDWMDAVWTHDRYTRCETPIYHGGLSKELVFQEVVSNSQASGADGAQPLGTLAGKGVMANKHKGGKVIVKVDEPSYIMGIVSLTPRLDYSQGNKWDMHLRTVDDLHKPALDEIGFQELITEQMAWWDTHFVGAGGWETRSAGKQPAWINYMTNVNQVRGNFADPNNEMFMTLNRRYEVDYSDFFIYDLTTYIDPVKFNHIFAQTAIDAQNFWTQISIDITARRKMSAKIMPNL